MKKALIYTFLILAMAFTTASSVTAQPHPGEQSPGNGSNPVGGNRIGEGAPVGNGTFILLALAMAYAGRKAYKSQTAEEETE